MCNSHDATQPAKMRRIMNLTLQVLWSLVVMLAVAALALTTVVAARQRYAGWSWWLGAIWAVSLGLAFVALGSPWHLVNVIAEWLLLQWPVAFLIGVRGFHARFQWPSKLRFDGWVLACAALVAAIGTLAWPVDSGPAALAGAGATLAVHLYVVCLLFCAPRGRDGAALRCMAAVLLACALFPVAWALPAWDAVPPLALRGFAAAAGCLVMSFVVVTLMSDRTESQLRDSRRRFRVLANVDALTRVPNRRRFEELATRMLTVDPSGSAALMIFDVDHFKKVNDNMGHAAGDHVLRLVGRCVQEALRANDVAGRQGGDEFVLLLRRASTAEAIAVANRIVARVQAQSHGAGLPSISLSFGIVHLHHGETLSEALRRADQALYEAKRQGRSRAVAADGDEANPVFTDSERLGLEAA